MMKNEMTKMEKFKKACKSIIANRNAKALNYAVNYAIHGLTIKDEYEAEIQALYILNNITHWRGDLAKETRALLKEVK